MLAGHFGRRSRLLFVSGAMTSCRSAGVIGYRKAAGIGGAAGRSPLAPA
jgi:hypothetical protein